MAEENTNGTPGEETPGENTGGGEGKEEKSPLFGIDPKKIESDKYEGVQIELFAAAKLEAIVGVVNEIVGGNDFCGVLGGVEHLHAGLHIGFNVGETIEGYLLDKTEIGTTRTKAHAMENRITLLESAVNGARNDIVVEGSQVAGHQAVVHGAQQNVVGQANIVAGDENRVAAFSNLVSAENIQAIANSIMTIAERTDAIAAAVKTVGTDTQIASSRSALTATDTNVSTALSTISG